MMASEHLPVVRPARADDGDALLAMARAAGPGMTSLPADAATLAAMLATSAARMEAGDAPAGNGALWFILWRGGEAIGACAIFPAVGTGWPFYSYRRDKVRAVSQALGRSITLETLSPSNHFDGVAEVGGLIVLPAERGGGAGRIAARSRYLFLAEHRGWFPDRVMAELRGHQDADGVSPVWEALGRPFYAMDFDAADAFGARHGNQFIAELGPRFPIYADLLSPAARAALGRPHAQSRPAYDMLLAEGFRDDGYIDIFDGGPQVSAEIDDLAAVRDCRIETLVATDAMPDETAALLSVGRGLGFRSTRGGVARRDGGIAIDAVAVERLGACVGDRVRWVAF